MLRAPDALSALAGFPEVAAAAAPGWVLPAKLVLDPILLYFEVAFVARIRTPRIRLYRVRAGDTVARLSRDMAGGDGKARGRWQPLELAFNADTGTWQGSLPVTGSTDLSYFVQAVDNRGNVSTPLLTEA